MLPTLVPGANRDNLLRTLRDVHSAAFNLRGGGRGPAQRRLVEYLDWATTAVRQLGGQISATDLDRLVLTPGYGRLLVAAGTMEGIDPGTQRVLNGLVSLELDERVAALDAAISALSRQVARWTAYGHYVVPDTNFYLHHPEKLRDVDFGPLIDVWESPVRVLVPIIIVDELDGLKQSRDKHVRWRAGHTLGVLDEMLTDPAAPERLRAGETGPSSPGAPVRSEVTIELFPDPPGHVRLPITDDEIVNRCLAIEALAARKVTLLTYDTGMSMRARAAGLAAVKLTVRLDDSPSQGARGDGRRSS